MNTILFIISVAVIFAKILLLPMVAEKYEKALNRLLGATNTAIGTVLFLVAYKASDIDPFIAGLTACVMLYGVRDLIVSCMECKDSCIERKATLAENHQIRKVG